MRIVAILGGGDWADASVAHLVVPPEVNVEQAEKDWRVGIKGQKYVPFVEYLKTLGARETTDEEVEIYVES